MKEWRPEIAYLLGGLTVLLLAWLSDRFRKVTAAAEPTPSSPSKEEQK